MQNKTDAYCLISKWFKRIRAGGSHGYRYANMIITMERFTP